MPERYCLNCGKRLRGSRRLWCSESCRKNERYGGRCSVCGATTSGGDGRAKAPGRCHEHSLGPQRSSETYAARQGGKRELVAQMMRDGASYEEIAGRLGTTMGTVGSFVHRLRLYGYDLPKRGAPTQSVHPWRRPLD